MPAEGLHLINVGDLEGQHRQERNAENGGEVIPGEAVARHDIRDVNRKTDADDQSCLDQANESGEHDRRISRLVGRFGDCARGRRKLMRLRVLGLVARHRRHRGVNRRSGSKIVFG